jgi:hypothetical protein
VVYAICFWLFASCNWLDRANYIDINMSTVNLTLCFSVRESLASRHLASPSLGRALGKVISFASFGFAVIEN